MGLFTDIIVDLVVFIIAIVLVAVVASYAAAAAASITQISNWSSNPKLASAHKYLSWAASIGWIFIGLVILLIVLLVIFAITGIFDFGLSDIYLINSLPGIITTTNFFTAGVLLTIGILSAIGTSDIDRSGATATTAKNKALTATLISLCTLGLVLIFYFIDFIINKQRKKNVAKQELLDFQKLVALQQ